MPKVIPIIGRDDDGNAKIVSVDNDGNVNTKLTGSDMELWGATTATRPDANTVKVGTVFIAIDNGQYNATVSDGTNWEDA